MHAATTRMNSFIKSLPILFLAANITTAEPLVIDDRALASSFQEGVGGFADDGNCVSPEELSKQAKEAPSQIDGITLSDARPARSADGVYLIGTVYKCDNCDKWHPRGIATAWALTQDGVMVTNYHVFEKLKGTSMGVCDNKGNTYPVTEVLAVDKAGDAAIFRVDADDLTPLPLGPTAEVGDRMHVISHPDRRFYMQTAGEVARYHLDPRKRKDDPVTWMTITADFAKGSSGGPALDQQGRVIGMVAHTQSIYYESKDGKPKGPFQMVVHNCVPVSTIKALVAASAPACEDPADDNKEAISE